MPLLPLEPFVSPDDLFAGEPPAIDSEAQWWVLHTRPRSEKALARRLLNRGIQFFLPLYSKQWRSAGRLLCSHVPLFAGYLFLRGDGEARKTSLETNLVANCLTVADQVKLQLDLGRVYRMITSGAPLSAEERLGPGAPVEIVHGPLAGLEGRVLRRGKGMRICVEVKFLRQGVSAEVESWMIRAL